MMFKNSEKKNESFFHFIRNDNIFLLSGTLFIFGMILAVGLFLSSLFSSCNTTPVIPSTASATQLIQMGQDAAELSNYKAAETYYLEVIRRYGIDTNIYIEARYELGHIYLTQKKYDDAYTSFMEILDIYSNAEFGSVPGAFKKLAQIGLTQIPPKYIEAK